MRAPVKLGLCFTEFTSFCNRDALSAQTSVPSPGYTMSTYGARPSLREWGEHQGSADCTPLSQPPTAIGGVGLKANPEL
eukprot:6179688-Pleurochrysis_carterae.AAC.2